MRRTVLLLASTALAVLLATGVASSQTADTTPSDTYLDGRPAEFSNNVSPRLSFTSNDATATFECKLDNAAFGSCASPKQLFLLSEGQHTFQVRAKDASGNVDATPAEHTWTVDSIDPKITFTERPGTATGPYENSKRITNDTTPTWAWSFADINYDPAADSCYLYDDNSDRTILEGCSSPLTFGAELPNGDYRLRLMAEDKAGNYGLVYNYIEVDTVAPKVSAIKPTGTLVGRYANVVVTLDDRVYGSKQFVNIYRKGTTTPLAVNRYADGNRKIEIDPKNALRRDTRYKVKVTTGVTDGANNLETPKTWSFKTK